MCKKYSIKLIPKRFRKKGKVFVDGNGDWYDFKKSKVPVDQIEKKILEIFNNTYSCYRFNSKKILNKGKKKNSFFNQYFFLNQKNETNSVIKLKKSKVFKICKLQKHDVSNFRSSFEKSLEDIHKVNILVLNEITKASFEVEPMIGELINKNDKLNSFMIETDQKLKIDVEKDTRKIFNFFAAVNNFQNKIRDKITTFYNCSFLTMTYQQKGMENDYFSNNFLE